MKKITEAKLLKILGREKTLELVSALPNERLPGKKFCNRILRKEFLREFEGRDIGKFAEKYRVTIQTLYNWLR